MKPRLTAGAMVAFTLFLALAGSDGRAFNFKHAGEKVKPQPVWSVYFSPYEGCTDAIVNEIASAKTSIWVQAYSFTSRPIAQALIAAHKRGVDVQVIADPEAWLDNHSEMRVLSSAGIPLNIDAAHSMAHNKIMILDAQVVITGSFNFTTAAESYNAENLLVIRDAGVTSRYIDNWTKHKAHSELYKGTLPARNEKRTPPKTS